MASCIQMSSAELIPSPLSPSEDNCWQNISPHSHTMPMESQTRLFLIAAKAKWAQALHNGNILEFDSPVSLYLDFKKLIDLVL